MGRSLEKWSKSDSQRKSWLATRNVRKSEPHDFGAHQLNSHVYSCVRGLVEPCAVGPSHRNYRRVRHKDHWAEGDADKGL